MTTNYMSNYSYGPDCFKEIPEVLDKYKVHKVFFIGGEKALKSSQEDVKNVLESNGFYVTGSFVYGKNATQSNIDKLVEKSEVQDADIIFGFGGGRALDTVKMVAKALDKTIFTFPTICSNCSAGTAIAVLYKDDGSFDKYGYPDVPAHVFINTSVIAKAPKEYFWAGVGDGISKAPEVEHAVAAAVERGVELPHTAVLGAAIAASSKDAFYKYGEQGIKDVENGTVSKAIEEVALDIVVSTGYASNLVNQDDFYYNSCHAHAFYNATTAIKKEKEPLHGQVVSFGVMVLHAYFNELEELKKVAAFNKKLGLPVTLEEIGLKVSDAEKITELAMQTNEYKQTPFDKEKYIEAIKLADKMGSENA